MKRKNTLAAVFMMLVVLFGFVPAPQPVLAVTTCDWAQFVADVTIPDGTLFKPGDPFNKTWRLRNIGSCTWTTDYSLYFVSGQQMNDLASVFKLPNSVAPGQTVDLTVSMRAPSTDGTYRGYWALKNASGGAFGIGATANKSFWVEIRVSGGGGGGGTGYDFVSNAGSAVWTSSAGTLAFPGNDGDNNGFVRKIDSPKLENGTTDTAPGLLTAPQNTYNGFIQGQYPSFKVQSGDRFQSIINCEYNATSCYVNFRLNYQIGTGPVRTYWSFNERYEGLFYRANIDLSALAGQDVKFILYVGAAGYATGDRALWGAPRITRGNVVASPTPTTPGPTNTPKPGVSACRASFVADVDYPDGTVVAPNTAFTKTWSIKNIGTCTWTTNFTLVFVSGDKMGGPDSQKLTSTVGPNTTFKISVPLTSPAANGTYRGYWMLKDDKGQLFGIGAAGDKPWWVEIAVRAGVTAVPTTPVPPGPSGGVYDFVAKAKDASWSSGAGALPFPGGDGDIKGFAFNLSSVEMETGATDTRPSLLMGPQNVTNGFVQGIFPAFTVQNGDRFQATIGCQAANTACFVQYELNYKLGSGAVSNFWTFRERYDKLTYNVNLDLSSLAGQNVQFILTVRAYGSPVGDRAVWLAPRITRPGAGTSSTATVTVTATPVTPSAATSTTTRTATPVTPAAATPTVTGTSTVTPTVTPVTPAASTPTVTPTQTVTPTPTTKQGSILNDGLAYANPFFGYQFKYPKNATITDQQQNSVRFALPFTPGTNLGEKYMDVVATQNTDSCPSSNPGRTSSENVTINGLSFLKETGEDHGAGQIYNWISYSTAKDKVCVNFTLVLHSSNPGNFPTQPPVFNLAAESAIIADMVSTFGWLAPYAVYNIVSSDILNVRTGAGVTYPIATTFAYDKKNVFRTGSKATASSAEWWEIYKPESGKGWVNASYLTEYRSTANVCADTRVTALLANFAAAVKSTDGAALSSLVSPRHGLAVRYSIGTANPVILSKSAVAGIFTSSASYNWGLVPGSGTEAVGTFKDKIQPKLLDVLNAAYQTTCNDFSHVGPVNHPWPSEYTNITSYALYKPGTPGTDLDWRTWIAGIEYVDGVPYIVALVQYQWEP